MERMTSREGRRDKVGRHVAAPARRGSPIVLRNRLCLITSNWLAVDNASGNTIIRKMVFSGHPFVSIAPCLWHRCPFTLLRFNPAPSYKPFFRGMLRKSDPRRCTRPEEETGAEATVTKETMDRRVRRGRAEVRLTARIRIED